MLSLGKQDACFCTVEYRCVFCQVFKQAERKNLIFETRVSPDTEGKQRALSSDFAKWGSNATKYLQADLPNVTFF